MARACDNREGCRKGQRGRCKCDPGLADHIAKLATDPTICERRIAGIHASITPERRAFLAALGRKTLSEHYADPANQAARSKRSSERMKAEWTPERRADASERMKAMHASYKAAQAADPVRNRLLASLRAAGVVR